VRKIEYKLEKAKTVIYGEAQRDKTWAEKDVSFTRFEMSQRINGESGVARELLANRSHGWRLRKKTTFPDQITYRFWKKKKKNDLRTTIERSAELP